MWGHLWPGTPEEEVPIGHITNGVHTESWLAPEKRALYERYFSANWLDSGDCSEAWRGIEQISDEEIRSAHQACKKKLVSFLRSRLKKTAVAPVGRGTGSWHGWTACSTPRR